MTFSELGWKTVFVAVSAILLPITIVAWFYRRSCQKRRVDCD